MIPRLDILPPPQRQLWPELRATPSRFVLYGGTAIALRLAHRESEDFAFFSAEPFDGDALLAEIPYLDGAQVVQRAPDTLTCLVDRGGPVRVSFFGGLSLNFLMVYGTVEDLIVARQRYDDDDFRRALRDALPGIFDARSWAYWHARLGMGPAPPRPVREFRP